MWACHLGSPPPPSLPPPILSTPPRANRAALCRHGTPLPTVAVAASVRDRGNKEKAYYTGLSEMGVVLVPPKLCR